MRKVEEEAKFLQNIELGILAFSMGIRKLFGFSIDEDDLSDEKKVLLTLHKMFQQGMLLREGDNLKISNEYEAMLTHIKEAKVALIVEAASEELPMCCCYIGENILISETTAFKDNAIRLCFKLKESFASYLEDAGYLPKLLSDDIKWDFMGWERIDDNSMDIDNLIGSYNSLNSDNSLISDNLMNSDNLMDCDNLKDSDNSLDSDDLLDSNNPLDNDKVIIRLKSMDTESGECLITVIVIEQLIGYLMIRSKQGRIEKRAYSKENFNEVLLDLMEV